VTTQQKQAEKPEAASAMSLLMGTFGAAGKGSDPPGV
jgi:hypothetical protein